MKTLLQSFHWQKLLLLLCLLLLPTLPVSAEKTDWYDKDYNFSQIKKAVVYDVVLTDTTAIAYINCH
jgi:hypothetical protein